MTIFAPEKFLRVIIVPLDVTDNITVASLAFDCIALIKVSDLGLNPSGILPIVE